METVQERKLVIDLDVCFDQQQRTLDEVLDELRERYSVKAEVVYERGPSGWPVARFVVPFNTACDFLFDYTGDLEGAGELLSESSLA